MVALKAWKMTDRNPMQMALDLLDFYRSTQTMTGLSGATLQTHKNTVHAGLDQQLALNPDYRPAAAPVLRFLPEALAAVPPHPVHEAILPFMPDLHWQSNDNYRGYFADSFFDNEAFTEIIGPKGKL